MDEEVFNTVALQTGRCGVVELYNPGSRAWDENRARANTSKWTQHRPAEALRWCAQFTDSTGSCQPRLQGAPGSLSITCCTSSVRSPAALPVSRIHLLSRNTVCCDKDEAEVSWYHCQPVPWHLPQNRAWGTSQPSVEPVSVALITSAVWMALLGH